MTLEKVPIFDDFDGAGSFIEMSEVLIRAPAALLGRYDGTLRNRLMHRHFQEGLKYLENVSAAREAVRDENGMVSMKTQELLLAASNALRRAAAARDAALEGGAG